MPSAANAPSANLQNIRKDYTSGQLDERDVPPRPIPLLTQWVYEATQAAALEPTAFVLATASEAGQPSVRVVLLKGLDEAGLVFYTNYQSRKGEELAHNAACAATFFWPILERQVRVEGTVIKLTPEQSEGYFHSRPWASQISALVSPQSQKVDSRAVLEELHAQAEKKYADAPVPYPTFWGGYQILPHRIEFWQGRPGRLHDRILYEKKGEAWEISRLAP